MKPKLKEEPKEWRKAAWMSLLGLTLLTSLLRWRRVLPLAVWLAIVCLLAMLAVAAGLRPRWWRGYYRFSTKAGFAISQTVGCAVLMVIFLLVFTLLAVVARLMGKDPLRLRRPSGTTSYWLEVRGKSSLDRLF